MRVGGQAEFFTKISTVDDLSDVVQWAKNESLPYLVLGGGSNILVSDAGVRGLVIQNRCRKIEIIHCPVIGHEDSDNQRPDDHSDTAEDNAVVAESGAAMAGVARTSVRHNLTGLEWAVSVPGTIGGAIVNNAGAHGSEIKDNLFETAIVDGEGEQRLFGVTELAYAYRSSSLKSKSKSHQAGFEPVVLWGKFKVASAPADAVSQRANEYLSHRRRTQPVEPSLGSMFMNPPGDFAGRLIEAAGLKGVQIGGIEVSEQHANFIINPGGVGSGKAADVIALIQLIQTKVEAKFGVHLKPEIQLVGEWE